MTLKDLGYNIEWEEFRRDQNLDEFELGRVVSEHKERYVVKTIEGEYEAEILGNMRYSSRSRSDFPAVGDWVAISIYDDDKALIHSIYPRRSVLERQSVHLKSEKQIIAANVDFAFIVQAVDRDFSINRMERYLAICHNAKIQPIIILNKIDLLDDSALKDTVDNVVNRIKGVPIYSISNKTLEGLKELKVTIEKGKTYCLLGSSGVGKSTLLNSIAEKSFMKTDAISDHSNRGKHVTTHRELHILENGGILIDNPGMREIGMTDKSGGLEITFDKITELALNCKFKDCTHSIEQGCAVTEAIEKGELDKSSYENYLKMQRERDHFESTVAEKRKKDKDFGKMVKNVMKSKKSDKY